MSKEFELAKKALDSLKETLPSLIDQVRKLKEKPDRTKVEEEWLKQLVVEVRELLQVMQAAKNYFGEETYRQSMAIYYHIKERAGAGDEEAQKMLEELKPIFESAIIRQISEN